MEPKVVLPKPTLMNHHNWNYEKIRFCILILKEECECHKKLVWPVPLVQVWTFYKIGKLNMWTLCCNVCINFLNSQIWKEIMLEWYNWMVSLQVFPRSQLIFPSKTWFFGIYLNFQWQKSQKNQYFPHSESKSYQINSIKSCS